MDLKYLSGKSIENSIKFLKLDFHCSLFIYARRSFEIVKEKAVTKVAFFSYNLTRLDRQ